MTFLTNVLTRMRDILLGCVLAVLFVLMVACYIAGIPVALVFCAFGLWDYAMGSFFAWMLAASVLSEIRGMP